EPAQRHFVRARHLLTMHHPVNGRDIAPEIARQRRLPLLPPIYFHGGGFELVGGQRLSPTSKTISRSRKTGTGSEYNSWSRSISRQAMVWCPAIQNIRF